MNWEYEEASLKTKLREDSLHSQYSQLVEDLTASHWVLNTFSEGLGGNKLTEGKSIHVDYIYI